MHPHTEGQFQTTVFVLSDLLSKQGEELGQTVQAHNDLLEENRVLQDEIRRVESDLLSSQSALVFQREISSDLRADLKDMEARVRLGTPTNQEVREAETCKVQRDLLLSLFQRPEVLRLLVNYMHTSGQTMWDMLDDQGYHTQKINIIKDVRQITQWGLKYAKDFVESYHWAPAASAVLPDLGSPGPQGACSDEGEGCTHHTAPPATVRDIIADKLGPIPEVGCGINGCTLPETNDGG